MLTENEYHAAVDKAMQPLERLAETLPYQEVQRLFTDVITEMELLKEKYGYSPDVLACKRLSRQIHALDVTTTWEEIRSLIKDTLIAMEEPDSARSHILSLTYDAIGWTDLKDSPWNHEGGILVTMSLAHTTKVEVFDGDFLSARRTLLQVFNVSPPIQKRVL